MAVPSQSWRTFRREVASRRPHGRMARSFGSSEGHRVRWVFRSLNNGASKRTIPSCLQRDSALDQSVSARRPSRNRQSDDAEHHEQPSTASLTPPPPLQKRICMASAAMLADFGLHLNSNFRLSWITIRRAGAMRMLRWEKCVGSRCSSLQVG